MNKDNFKFISYELINDTLNTINIHYGKGKINYFTLESNGIGKVFIEIPISHYGRLKKQYKFKLLKDDFVLFLGKKRKLGYKIR